VKKVISIAGVKVPAAKFYNDILPTVKKGFLLTLADVAEVMLLEPDIEKRKARLSRAEQLRMLKELTEGALTVEKMSPRLIKFSESSWRRWRKFLESVLDELQGDIEKITACIMSGKIKERQTD